MAKGTGMSWNTVDGLNPRLRLSIGITVPVSKRRYSFIRPEICVEIDKPFNMSTSDTLDQLETMLIDRLDEMCDRLIEHYEEQLL